MKLNQIIVSPLRGLISSGSEIRFDNFIKLLKDPLNNFKIDKPAPSSVGWSYTCPASGEYEFDLNGKYPFTKMLENQVNGKINSWAIRWYASSFLNNLLTLYPKNS